MSVAILSAGGSSEGFAIVVHGGAGNVPEERRHLHEEGALRAAQAGAEVLRAGGSALDAVERAVRALEDDPLFNAGRGACLDEDGNIELDASIMEGTTLRAGAVCALAGFAAPIAIARAALDEGRHVLYAAHGARRFAKARGFVEVPREALLTESALLAFERAKRDEGAIGWAGGTVGAVARDARGRLAAATSTGGKLNKRAGRVGDSPLIGAGTFADDNEGAVSTTGDGEAMIRLSTARMAAIAMRSGQSAEAAARAVIADLRDRLSATGGLITVDPRGGFGLARSTASMSWAAVTATGDRSGV